MWLLGATNPECCASLVVLNNYITLRFCRKRLLKAP